MLNYIKRRHKYCPGSGCRFLSQNVQNIVKEANLVLVVAFSVVDWSGKYIELSDDVVTTSEEKKADPSMERLQKDTHCFKLMDQILIRTLI